MAPGPDCTIATIDQDDTHTCETIVSKWECRNLYIHNTPICLVSFAWAAAFPPCHFFHSRLGSPPSQHKATPSKRFAPAHRPPSRNDSFVRRDVGRVRSGDRAGGRGAPGQGQERLAAQDGRGRADAFDCVFHEQSVPQHLTTQRLLHMWELFKGLIGGLTERQLPLAQKASCCGLALDVGGRAGGRAGAQRACVCGRAARGRRRSMRAWEARASMVRALRRGALLASARDARAGGQDGPATLDKSLVRPSSDHMAALSANPVVLCMSAGGWVAQMLAEPSTASRLKRRVASEEAPYRHNSRGLLSKLSGCDPQEKRRRQASLLFVTKSLDAQWIPQ